MRGLGFLKRLVGLFPKRQARSPSGNHVEPSKPWPRTDAGKQQVVDALEEVTERLHEFTDRVKSGYFKNLQPPDVIKAPPWLVQRMAELKARTPPTPEEVQTQMESSARLRRMLDRGMTQEEAKQFALDHSDDILAHLDAPWREKIGPNRYKGSCGCVFDSEGHRVEWCGDHY